MTGDKIRFTQAAKFYREEPHQIAAWNYLESKIPADVMAEFAELYRAAPAAKESAYQNTWSGVAQAARVAGARFPELVAAQWALESNWGKSVTGRHNYFGQKGPGTVRTTQEVINGKRVTVNAEFLDFKDLGDSVQYVVDRWHRDWKEHKGVNRAKTREEAARLLVVEGYATDPDYADKLIRLMDQNAPKAAEPVKVRPSSPFSTKLTPNFTLGEFALEQESRRFRHQYQVDTAIELAQFLEKMRAAFSGKSVTITSGYRPPEINRSVGGASGSEHLYDAPGVGAVDVVINGVSVWEIQKWADREWPYSLGYGAPRGFIHLGIRQGRPRVRWDY